MNVIFVGTSEFAVPSLEALIASHHDVLAVVTQPDKPRGRGREMQMPPVKEIALAHGIPILQPEKIRDPQAIAEIKEFGPLDALIVAAYGQKIPLELLEWPKHGCINVHGSILPKYRGAAPIQHAIIAGEQQTGVTTMLMAEGLDTGDILLQESIDIDPNENAGELSKRLALLGARLLIHTLEDLEDSSVVPIPQDDELATIARSLKRNAGVIDWSKDANTVVNLVRGCTPKPGAFTRMNNALLKLINISVEHADGNIGEPGEVIDIGKDGVVVAAGSGSVKLKEVQPESRKRMSAADYARGGLKTGDKFDPWFEMPE